MSAQYLDDFDGTPLAMIVWATNYDHDHARFYTAPEMETQVGIINIPRGEAVPGHVHPPRERAIRQTSEVLVVLKGTLLCTIYNDHKEIVGYLTVKEGEVLIQFKGGHGFKATEDVKLLEIKQGPYDPALDKQLV